MSATNGSKKLKSVLGVAGSVAGATGAATSLRKARAERDRLLLANAIAGIALAVTGLLLAIRALKKGGDER